MRRQGAERLAPLITHMLAKQATILIATRVAIHKKTTSLDRGTDASLSKETLEKTDSRYHLWMLKQILKLPGITMERRALLCRRIPCKSTDICPQQTQASFSAAIESLDLTPTDEGRFVAAVRSLSDALPVSPFNLNESLGSSVRVKLVAAPFGQRLGDATRALLCGGMSADDLSAGIPLATYRYNL